MVVNIMSLKVSAYGLSDIGLVRQNNEDVWDQLQEENFYVLADGMGGHQAGEIAAREAVNELCRSMKKVLKEGQRKKGFQEIREALKNAIQHVNDKIYQLSSESEVLRGMGTTLCCLYLHEEGLIYGHVGDSRIYRLRDKHLKLLTKDHSLLRELVELGQLTEKQAMEFLYKNIITKAIGTESSVEPTINIGDIHDQDLYLLCSDGLTDLLTKEEIEKILNRSQEIQSAAQHLVDQAKEKGGNDNITVVLILVQKT